MNERPLITYKYNRKIRLLLTNFCPRNCPFCHNEGMGKLKIVNMDFKKIEKFLPVLKDVSNRVVLSGGEPFSYPRLEELLIKLDERGFDITIDTSVYILKDYYGIINHISGIHISLIDYNDIKCFLDNLKKLRNRHATLKIIINIPLYDLNSLQLSFEDIFSNSMKYGYRIQLINIYEVQKKVELNWAERWQSILQLIQKYDMKVFESTNREVSYKSDTNVIIDLVDIPCVLAGKEFEDGVCLNECDYTITPEFNVYFCRWNKKNAVLLQSPQNLYNDLNAAYEKSCLNCFYQKIGNLYKKSGIDELAYKKHYNWPPVINDISIRIDEQIKIGHSSYYGKEGYVRSFENNFAQYLGVDFTLSLCSGTAALYIACLALNLSNGVKVVVSNYSYPGILTALVHAKAKILFCDTEDNTGNIDVNCLKKLLDYDIGGIIITHLWGAPANIAEITNMCRRRGIKLIEDCSHAFGATFNNEKVGTYGDVSCFSLQSNKAVYAGEGGILATNNREIYEKAVLISMLKKRISDCVINSQYLDFIDSGMGLKLKIHPFGAIMANYALSEIEEVNKKRREHIELMASILAERNNIISPPIVSRYGYDKRTYYTFKFILNDIYIQYRDRIINNLIKENLDVTSSSFLPLHKLNISYFSEDIININDNFCNSEKYEKRIISIPSFTYEDTKISAFYAYRILDTIDNIINGGKYV